MTKKVFKCFLLNANWEQLVQRGPSQPGSDRNKSQKALIEWPSQLPVDRIDFDLLTGLTVSRQEDENDSNWELSVVLVIASLSCNWVAMEGRNDSQVSSLSRTLPLSLSQETTLTLDQGTWGAPNIMITVSSLVSAGWCCPGKPAQRQGQPRNSRKPSHWYGRRLRQWNFAASYNPPLSLSRIWPVTFKCLLAQRASRLTLSLLHQKM